MARIRLLTPAVAAKIAAGEVISRPAAVVKELVENSLDAGAANITVEIEEGGRRLIRVVDDGCGMTPEEAALSLKRHATSKLAEESDLLNITTLGFRGEALPSIAAVSRLELLSRPLNAPHGHRLAVRAGELMDSAPGAAPVGTQVKVEELFFNTPARRKFLKSKDAEQAYIVETLRHLALGYPEVAFHLRAGPRTLLAAARAASLKDRVADVFGPELAARMLAASLGDGLWQVAALLGDADFSLASRRFQALLVNRRVVQDKILGAVLKEVYRGLMPRGRHPGAVVLLSVPLDRVDVNVHPAKTEVRFQDPGRVYGLLLAALKQGLGVSGAPPAYRVTWQPQELPQVREAGLNFASPGASAPVSMESRPAFSTQEMHPQAPDAVPIPPRGDARFRFQDLMVLGQLQAAYILAQGAQGLVIIDQHAAHERILYESLKSRAQSSRQALLFPRVIEVSPSQADWVQENLSALAQAGLELSPFGGASFLITAAPGCLAQADVEAVALSIIEALAPMKSHAGAQEVAEQTLTLMACHGAIKAGQPLSREEIQTLLKDLDESPVSSHCPHGRPLWRLIPYGDIRHSFRRPRN